LSACNYYLDKLFLNVRYIAPIRASAERFYRIQGLSVDEIDPQGENIPMILHNMSEKDRNEFSGWTLEQFEFEVLTRLEGGHVSLRIKYQASSEEINLADTGFGYSQILPIILLLWRAVKNRSNQPSTIVIEQPELHLHPSLQARLIDTFVKIIILSKQSEVDLKIIFETHSETMVNRIGYLLAKKIEGFKKEYINVIIFDKIEAYRSEINITSYTDQGYLKSWPIGFFSPEDL
jgi:predicted ATPase